MKYETGQANRLGNRSSNEDCFAIVEDGKTVLLVLADGMGGHSGGQFAAQTLVSTMVKHFRACTKPIADLQEFLTQSLVAAHRTIVELGRRHQPPISPRTTGVACIVQDGIACWAHVGDSRLYLFRGDRVVFRTTDDSYVEELYREGRISRQEALKHPKRHQLTECIGGDATPPMITRGTSVALQHGDMILLCSDGLWAALDDARIGALAQQGSLEQAVDTMAHRAEDSAYPQSDNISIVALRWLGEQTDTAAAHAAGQGATPAVTAVAETDKLSSAIDEIERTIKRFEHEMKQ